MKKTNFQFYNEFLQHCIDKSGSNLKIRLFLDLSEHTEDNGNTLMYVAFLGYTGNEDFTSEVMDIEESKVSDEWGMIKSMGDYIEELVVIQSNGELVCNIYCTK